MGIFGFLQDNAPQFATIVGLICNYNQERGGKETLSAPNFLVWLEEHRHESTKQLLEANQNLLNSLYPIFQANQDDLLNQFEFVNKTLAQILSKIDIFEDAAKKFVPNSVLSEQAFNILKVLDESRVNQLDVTSRFGTGITANIGHEPFNITDSKFLKDDIATLLHIGYLIRKSDTDQSYNLTRNGAEFVKNVLQQ